MANHGIIELNIGQIPYLRRFVGWNEFGVDGAKAVAAAVKDNDTLLCLDMRND